MYNFLLEKMLVQLTGLLKRNSFYRQLHLLREESVLNESNLAAMQLSKLSGILEHAVRKSKYYQSVPIDRPNDVVQWLKKFPVLTKELLLENREVLLTEPVEKLVKQSSSGSTGMQSTVYWSDEEQNRHRASQIVWWEWAGYKMGTPILQTGITPNRGLFKSVKDFFFRTYYLSAFAHTDLESAKAFEWAKRQINPVLGGYASSLFVLAKQAEQKGTKLKFSAAITWGDKLFDHYRKQIERTFDTQVFETYGSAEGLMMAAQKDLPYMYIMTNNVYLELLDDEGNEVKDGDIGHVVVTSLNAYAMPLIRYRIGDLAIKLPRDKYPQNRDLSFPLLQRVIGRDTDLVKTKSGKYMVVHSFTGIFEHISEIKQFCVVQRELNGIEIEYVPAHNFKLPILDSIRAQIISALGEEFSISFKAVTDIKPTKSGKPQIIQSFLPRENF